MQSTSQSYISDELTHFVGRGKSPKEQLQLLIDIVRGGRIMHPPFNPRIQGNITVNINESISNNEKMFAPEIICFADIPFNSLEIHTIKYSRFGISFSKNFVAKNGGSPIRYIPLSARSNKFRTEIPSKEELDNLRNNNIMFDPWANYPQSNYFDEMIHKYHKLMNDVIQLSNDDSVNKIFPDLRREVIEIKMFLASNVFSYIKFFDHKLSDYDENNYYFEREWRIVGHLPFNFQDIQHVFVPRAFVSEFVKVIPELQNKVIELDYD